MRNLMLSLTFVLSAAPLAAQKHVYEDLLVLYVDEQYEKCLAKAESYTMKEETRKDALPFLYMSMSLYEMSKLEKYQEDYPKAAREAIKYAEKYRRKDKDLEFFTDHEDYWAELNTMAMEMGLNEMENPKGGMSKAKQVFDGMVGYYPENPGAWLMLAITQYNSNLAKDGDLSVQEFEKAYAAVPDLTRLPEDQKRLLRTALIRFSEYQEEKGMKDAARQTMEKGKALFMEDAEFKMRYEELN